MTGARTQACSWPLNFKRLTWQARNPKPALPTVFDGDWAGIEFEREDLKIHFILHISNTEDDPMIFFDCPDERFEGARATKVTYNQEFAADIFQSRIGSVDRDDDCDGKALDSPVLRG